MARAKLSQQDKRIADLRWQINFALQQANGSKRHGLNNSRVFTRMQQQAERELAHLLG